MKTQIENQIRNISTLNNARELNSIIGICLNSSDLITCYNSLIAYMGSNSDYFIYKGNNHLAVHESSYNKAANTFTVIKNRLLLITE